MNTASYSAEQDISKSARDTLGTLGRHSRISSSDNIADVVMTQLEQFVIALRVLSKYPDAMNDFRLAIAGAIQ